MKAYFKSRLINAVRPLARNNKKLRTALLSIDTRVALFKHSVAEFLPGIIKPEVRNLTVAITANCNLRCIGCRYGRDFMVGQELRWPIMKGIFDDAKHLGISSVRLYGGEPLLHKDLGRFIRYATDHGIRPYITTNGILLEKRIAELYDAGLRSMTVGFYGTGAAYDGYVQGRNRFIQLERSIATVRSLYGTSVAIQINWLLKRTSCTLTALDEVVQFARRYSTPIQVDLIHYSLPYFTEGPERELQFRPDDVTAIKTVVNELLNLKRESPTLLVQSEMGLRSIPDWLIKGEQMRVPCDKYQMIWIGADGTVQLCYVTFKLGNLYQQRLVDLLYTDAHRAAARDCFALKCPNCHCGLDTRVQKHLASRRLYGTAGDRVALSNDQQYVTDLRSGVEADKPAFDIPFSSLSSTGIQKH